MGTSAQPEQQPLRVDVTLDEMEAQQKKAEEEAKAAEGQQSDDSKPAASAEPSPREKALEEALRISEDARKRMESQLTAPAPAAPTAEPKPEAPKELTKEELSELFSKDPLQAVDYMTARAAHTAEVNLGKRLAPLLSGTASSAESQARQKYPAEFELFGDQIQTFVSNHPDKSAFSNPANWDDLISWMRGRPGNFEKLQEHHSKKSQEKAAADAQALQAASAGATVRSDIRTPAPVGQRPLDQTEQEIVKELANSGILTSNDPEAEYRRWREVGK